jgi:hypothetical protein
MRDLEKLLKQIEESVNEKEGKSFEDKLSALEQKEAFQDSRLIRRIIALRLPQVMKNFNL